MHTVAELEKVRDELYKKVVETNAVYEYAVTQAAIAYKANGDYDVYKAVQPSYEDAEDAYNNYEVALAAYLAVLAPD